MARADRPEPRPDRPAAPRGVRPLPPDGLTAKAAITTLHDHLNHDDFRTDTSNLIAGGRTGYDFDVAAQLIVTEVLSHL